VSIFSFGSSPFYWLFQFTLLKGLRFLPSWALTSVKLGPQGVPPPAAAVCFIVEVLDGFPRLADFKGFFFTRSVCVSLCGFGGCGPSLQPGALSHTRVSRHARCCLFRLFSFFFPVDPVIGCSDYRGRFPVPLLEPASTYGVLPHSFWSFHGPPSQFFCALSPIADQGGVSNSKTWCSEADPVRFVARFLFKGVSLFSNHTGSRDALHCSCRLALNRPCCSSPRGFCLYLSSLPPLFVCFCLFDLLLLCHTPYWFLIRTFSVDIFIEPISLLFRGCHLPNLFLACAFTLGTESVCFPPSYPLAHTCTPFCNVCVVAFSRGPPRWLITPKITHCIVAAPPPSCFPLLQF